ncbi:TrkH family potassium uptake protein [Lacticaseibacillus daqingensis]|uniref:TrkH family potassium uptake protein n=1 Tax=Lacticaseibacillus daqingensis TaxID=2486014 RepID=UPI0013DDC71B|nr:potassium transporter TrkG [Lacticaseibacillus daqingensis]
MKNAHWRLSAPQAILLSFAAMIAVGTVLLNLPWASQDGQSIGWLNALFTATSANCVTGLVVVNTMQHWTLFGQLVILALIQLGGIGFITVVTGTLIIFRRRIGLRQRMTIQTMFNAQALGGMTRLVLQVLKYTAVIEGAGAVLLTIGFLQADRGYTLGEAAWYGVFHAISAFCNAGFDIVGVNSLTEFAGSWWLNLTLMALITLGGLGFVVLHELKHLVENRRPWRQRLRHLSVHTKLVCWTSLTLFAVGTLLVALLEWGNPETLGSLDTPHKWLAAAFESVTLRTAGFLTVDQNGLGELTKLVAAALMFIGGSPAGTAGGIKTITLAVLGAAVLSALRGHADLVIFNRRLPLAVLQKALAIVGTLGLVVTVAVIGLHFSETANAFHPKLLDLIFETTSAAGTVGLTTGMTPFLTPVGKVIIALCMFIGRLSPLTIAVALNTRLDAHPHTLTYPEEAVIVG